MLAIGDRLQTVGGCLEQRTSMAVRGAAVRSFDALVFCDSELHKSTAEEPVAVVGVLLFVGLRAVNLYSEMISGEEGDASSGVST